MRSKPATLPRPQMGTSRRRRPNRPRKTRLDRLIEEAIVDAYGESEQAVGLYTMIEEHLALPFETMVLGVPVTVVRVDLTQRDELVAVCRRAGVRQAVPILDLPLPSRRPAGAEWIDAYRRWARGRLIRVPLHPRHGTAAAGSATRPRCLTQIKNSVVRDPAVRCRATDLWVRKPQGLRRAP